MKYVVFLMALAATPAAAKIGCVQTLYGQTVCGDAILTEQDDEETQARIDQEVAKAREQQEIQDIIMEPAPGEEH